MFKKILYLPTVLLLVLAISLWTAPAAFAQVPAPLAAKNIPKWVNQLPLLDEAGGTMDTALKLSGGNVTVKMCEFDAYVLPPLAVGQAQLKTRVWGYLVDTSLMGDMTCAELITQYGGANGVIDTHIGPVIVAGRSHFPITGTTVDKSIAVTWVNNLGTTTTSNLGFWKTSTDQTLHWADPLGTGMTNVNYAGPIPAVPHLHGGEVPPQLDGGPDAWFTSDSGYKGHAYYSKDGVSLKNYAIYDYPNTQEAANIWFHDHVLGITRLNVYAGMAGAYVITDPDLVLPTGLHPVGLQQGATGTVDYIIPLVIQDRMFDTAGQLVFPAVGINPEHPFWIPEFVGDTIQVNGKVWPTLGTAAAPIPAKRYRFLFLNGSNARTYELYFPTGIPLWVIGTDGGYLDAPAKLDQLLGQRLVIMPGERYDVIIDFGPFANTTQILRNSGRTPYPKGAPPQGSTLAQIVQFVIGAAPPSDLSYNPDPAAPTYGGPIRTGTQTIKRLVNPLTGTPAIQTGTANTPVAIHKVRQLTLNEVMGAGGPLEILLNNTKWDGYVHTTDAQGNPIKVERTGFGYSTHFEGYSEMPNEGETELWEIINITADAHPIHLHLVQFQLMNRQNFNVNKYITAYNGAFNNLGPDPLPAGCVAGAYCPGYGPPNTYITANADGAVGGNPPISKYLQGRAAPPLAHEAGWKDTVVMYPGQVTRILVRWAPTDLPNNTAGASAYYPFSPDGTGITGSAISHGYVWHCHIIDHEDNEMMRPTSVTRQSVTRTYTSY